MAGINQIKCETCGASCTPGVDAVEIKGKDVCDRCAGQERASNGMLISSICACLEIVGDNPECPVHGSA